MFIRKKGNYYHLVQSHRVNGKVKQKIVAYLGRCETIEERLYHVSRLLCADRDLQKPGWKWRRRIALRLNLTEQAFAKENPVKSAGEPQRSTFSEWYDQKIDAYVKAKYERDSKRDANRIAYIQRQSAKLWSIVPRAERARVKAYIKMREAQDLRKGLELRRKMAQEFKRVVPR